MGFWVEPREIESFLMAQAGVDGARVVGAPDADGQEIAVAFVKFSAAGEVNACDELRSFAGSNWLLIRSPHGLSPLTSSQLPRALTARKYQSWSSRPGPGK